MDSTMYACNFKFTSKSKMALYIAGIIFRDIVLYTIVSDVDEESIRIFHRIGVNHCIRFFSILMRWLSPDFELSEKSI